MIEAWQIWIVLWFGRKRCKKRGEREREKRCRFCMKGKSKHTCIGESKSKKLFYVVRCTINRCQNHIEGKERQESVKDAGGLMKSKNRRKYSAEWCMQTAQYRENYNFGIPASGENRCKWWMADDAKYCEKSSHSTHWRFQQDKFSELFGSCRIGFITDIAKTPTLDYRITWMHLKDFAKHFRI